MDELEKIKQSIIDHEMNVDMKAMGYTPVYTASPKAMIVIVGQAPGRVAQTTMKPWNDISGVELRKWLGVTDEEFYNPDIISLIPMDFYYPGKGKHGDLPPRKGFAELWHPQILKHMPGVRLTILVGAYSQKYYLGKKIKSNLTQTVHAYEEYLPDFLPLVHPSPLNFRWQTINPWFKQELVPKLPGYIRNLIDDNPTP